MSIVKAKIIIIIIVTITIINNYNTKLVISEIIIKVLLSNRYCLVIKYIVVIKL